MVRHIVFWNLKEENADANAALIKEKLESLVGVVDGLLKAEVTRNFTPGGHDLCLYSEFADRASLDGYQVHPLHLEAKAIVHRSITARAVHDSEI